MTDEPRTTVEPISRNRATQEQVSGILLIREVEKRNAIAQRQAANGCTAKMHASQIGLPCCYADRPICLCQKEALKQ